MYKTVNSLGLAWNKLANWNNIDENTQLKLGKNNMNNIHNI